jgi:hypothetical protein
MIGNIIDHRTNTSCVDVDVIFEPSCHDNPIKGATQFDEHYREDLDYFSYNERYNTTLEKACAWANSKNLHITIFLYDAGYRPGDVKED